MQLSTQCRACGTINFLKYVNNFLSTNHTTLILTSLVRIMTKNPNLIFFNWGGGGFQDQGIKERGELGRQSNDYSV